MALRNFFKKGAKKEERKEKPKEKPLKKEVRKPIKKEVKVAEKPPEAAIPKVKKGKRIDLAWAVLKAPHVTEKATDLVKKNQYAFKVFPKANKFRIKKAVEGLYGVDVVSVKIVNVPAKKRRLGRISGLRKGYKKAIIKIKEGQKIEVLPR